MEKKKFKMPSSFTVLFLIIIVIAALTWIIPAGQYDKDDDGNLQPGTYKKVEQKEQGLWNIATAPVYGMLGKDVGEPNETSGAISVSLFILVIGGFLGVVNKTGAIDAGIASLIRNSGGKEKRLIPILMVIFAIGGSTYGMCEETMGFYPLLIPVMLAAGFDTMTAVATILLGAGVGTLASTVNPFATGVASDAVGIGLGDGIIWRLLIFVLCVGFSIWYVYRYASKVEKDPSKSYVADTWEDDKKHFALSGEANQVTGKQKTVLWLFGGTFVFMILSLVPWDMIFPKFTALVDFNEWLHKIPFLGKFIGESSLPIGWWYFTEITMLFLIMAIVIGVIYRLKESEIVDAFIDGARDLLGVALIVALARGIQVIMNDGYMTATVLHWGEVGLKNLSPAIFSVLTFVFYLPMSFLIPSTSGLASATMGIIGNMGQFVDVPAHIIVTAFQSASGIVNLITPTSAVVMGALAIARMDYGKWLKFSAKLIGYLLIVNAAVLALATILS